jgi:NitT/TauT family transport system substrate-binding protein
MPQGARPRRLKRSDEPQGSFTMIKPSLFLALGAALVAAAAPHPAASQAPAKITIGTGKEADFLPAFVARDKGLFAKHGLDANLVVMPTPSLVPPALVSGSVQIGASAPPNILLAADGGLDIVAIAGAARLVASNPKTSLVTRRGVTVAHAGDLAGKKVGVPDGNSVIGWFLRKWLIEHRVPVARVAIVETPVDQTGDLLKSGQIDAAALGEPLLSRIVAGGGATKSVDFVSQVNPDVLGTFWAATRTYAAANGPVIAAFRAALADAVAFIRSNRDEAKAIEQKELGFADPAMPEFAVRVDPEDFVFFVKVGHELGVSRQRIDVTKLVFQ